MYAININSSEEDYATLILQGIKTIETRNKPTLDQFLESTVGLIETGKGKPMLVGTVFIERKIVVNSKEEFDSYFDRHLIGENSKYYWNGKKKYLYVLSEPVVYEIPKEVGWNPVTDNRTFRIVEDRDE